jgi:Asp-tRNA(Asn)/Glu-tRNA(Gln) amidotransferase A subunit family amidase
VTPEYAIQRAREAERDIARGQYRGPLHGIPYMSVASTSWTSQA